MPKTVKGGPLRFFNNHSVAKFQKIEGRKDPLRTLKNFRKKSHKAEKVRTFCFGILVNKPGTAQVGAISKAQK